MFGVYFGKYLEQQGVLTEKQYMDIIEQNRNKRVKLGLIAVNLGFMTDAQAAEVNELQKATDARFGDIAIEKGYLTETQVGELLAKQGDSYMLFVQALTEGGYLTMAEIRQKLTEFKIEYGYKPSDMEALLSSDTDRILDIFIRDVSPDETDKNYLRLIIRNIVRFVDNRVRLDKAYRSDHIDTEDVAVQRIEGDVELFCSLAGEGNKVIGEGFGQEEFESLDEDCLDACCEFLNVTNGLFARHLSSEGDETEMLPPEMYPGRTELSGAQGFIVLPMYVRGVKSDLIISTDAKANIRSGGNQ